MIDLGFRVDKKKFISKYFSDFAYRLPKRSPAYRILSREAERLYDQVTKYGVILVDEKEIRRRIAYLSSIKPKNEVEKIRISTEIEVLKKMLEV